MASSDIVVTQVAGKSDLKAFIDGERAKWRPVIEAAKITM